MVKYLVSNKKFNNVYLALYESYLTGLPIKFYCFDDVYDQHVWLHEPSETIDELMDQHAHDLRNRYDCLVLLWSGGYDSHTIYQVFKRNKIHIDIIHYHCNKKSPQFPEEHFEWMNRNHWDPTTQIRTLDDRDSEFRKNFVNSEDWLVQDQGDLFRYGTGSTGYTVSTLYQDTLGNKSWKAICGYEKPRLVYRKGRWYHRQLGNVLQHTMGHEHIEYFFLQPKIAIKQAHILKRNVKNYIKATNQPLYDGDWAEAKYSRDPAGMHAWNLACGRLPELTYGVSSTQKSINEQFYKMKLNLIGDWKNLLGNSDLQLHQELEQGHATAVNYVKGLYSLTSNRLFFSWLKDHGWLRNPSQNILDLKFIWSKEYDLGV
jgi:hypothetical protein